MNWVTVIWSMIAAACLTLAAAHLLVWFRRRTAWANLLFSLTAVATAGLAACELWVMRAQTPEEFGAGIRRGHVPYWVIVVSLVGFVRTYLRAGRPAVVGVAGGAIVFFVSGSIGQFVLTFWGFIHNPVTPSVFFLAIVAVMSCVLSQDVLRVAQLSVDLRESDERLDLAAEPLERRYRGKPVRRIRGSVVVCPEWRPLPRPVVSAMLGARQLEVR